MWGFPGGGPPLVACTALLPDLVAAAAGLASPAPYDAAGLDWFAGMSPGAAKDAALMFADRAASRATFERERRGLLSVSAAGLAEDMKSLLQPGDDPGSWPRPCLIRPLRQVAGGCREAYLACTAPRWRRS
jgi:hypothetical protein